MAKKLIDILSDAAVVRDETNEKANTAERVGGVLVELANYLSAFAPVSDVTVETEGDYVRLVLHIKNEDGTVSTRSVTLPAASTSSAGVLTSELLKALNAADRSNEDLAQEGISKAESASAMLFAEEAERKAADAELLKRIIGKSTASSAYNDPFRYLTDYQSEKDASGTITKHAIRVMQDALLDTLRHSDYRESFPYIGHMRAHIEGVPIEMWTYVKAWNTGSTNGVFVQVVRTNFGLKNGVISSALTSEFHEYFRTVTVSMVNGSVTDVTATAWKEITADIRDMADEGISKADAALSQIHEERQERAAQDRVLSEAVSQERTERTAADAELQAKISETRENTAAYLNQLKEKVDANTTRISAVEYKNTEQDSRINAAQETANSARETATAASTAAQEAKTAADNANNLAQEAKETAEDAQKIKEYKLLHSHTFTEDATSSDYELLTADDGTPIHQYKDILIFAELSYVEGGSDMFLHINTTIWPQGSISGLVHESFTTNYIFKLKIDGLNSTLYSENHTNSFSNPQYADGKQGVNFFGFTNINNVFTYDRLIINFPFKANNKILIYGR